MLSYAFVRSMALIVGLNQFWVKANLTIHNNKYMTHNQQYA